MEQITVNSSGNIAKDTAQAYRRTQKKLWRGLLGNFNTFAGIFIVAVAALVLFTDVSFDAKIDIYKLGLRFVILFICSYSMYLNSADSGTMTARKEEAYKKAVERYQALKDEIIKKASTVLIGEFCMKAVSEELIRTRTVILLEVGIAYETYEKEYISKTREEIKASYGDKLTKNQIKAISKANKLKPIKLTPDMILRRGKHIRGRNLLGTSPEEKRRTHDIVRFVRSLFSSLIMGFIVLDVIAAPTFATFAEAMLKIMTVVISGVRGYSIGYENISVDTVDYVNHQADLITEFNIFVEEKRQREVSE